MIEHLTLFARKHGLLCEECVSNCPLVIDGNDLMISLKDWCYDETDKGGIYQNYAGNVAMFFCDLQRCGIFPVVLLHDELPVRLGISPEVLEFDSDVIQQSYKDHGLLLAEDDNSQLLYENIFLQVLRRLEIPHIVCLNDATAEFTALARKLDCPIMGDQSKYLTLNVVAVKIPWNRATLRLRHPPPGQTGFYMPCDVFRPERFLKKFGISAEMLPLVSTIPSIGPHPPALFGAFFEKLEEQYDSAEQEPFRRLDLLMPWLSGQDSIEAALEEVLCRCQISEQEKWDIKDEIFRIKSCQEKSSLEFLRDARTMMLPKGMVLCDIAAAVAPPAPTEPTQAPTDPTPALSIRPIPTRRPPLYDPTPPAVKTAPAWVKFPHPPALQQAAASGAVHTSCLRAVYNVPIMLPPMVEDHSLPFSRMAAVPLQARLSALLGAPTQPLVLLGVHRGENHQLLASCTWGAPLLERVLLGDEQSRLRAALCTLQLRPNTLDALPELLRLPAAALVEWRRVTNPRSGRGQVTVVLLTLLAMTPADTPPSALGLSASAAAEWRTRAWPWRFAQPSRGRTDRKAMHLQNELQDVYKTVLSVNEVLDQPLQQLDAVDTIHVPMMMLLGGDGITEPGEEVMSLVDAVADTVEEEVRWWLDNGRQNSGSAGAPAWTPPHSRQGPSSSEHPDLGAVRELTGLINKLTGENAPRLLEKMRHVSVQTEYGLYALVDVLFRAVLKMPRLIDICADACAVLDKLQVKSDRRDGTAVSFGDFMLTRLSRGLAPVNRNTLSREDLLHHLETVEDPAERRRQLRELTDCWRQAERRRCVCLLLLAALIRRNLVPLRAAGSCFSELVYELKPKGNRLRSVKLFDDDSGPGMNAVKEAAEEIVNFILSLTMQPIQWKTYMQEVYDQFAMNDSTEDGDSQSPDEEPEAGCQPEAEGEARKTSLGSTKEVSSPTEGADVSHETVLAEVLYEPGLKGYRLLSAKLFDEESGLDMNHFKKVFEEIIGFISPPEKWAMPHKPGFRRAFYRFAMNDSTENDDYQSFEEEPEVDGEPEAEGEARKTSLGSTKGDSASSERADVRHEAEENYEAVKGVTLSPDGGSANTQEVP
ncbi:uncharacterized protein LOC122371860 [Amphibalanus amphitrite]|uniref:uncharacterized protein LOC122371860 n=1 Tax=Amphibalanus amphitrite TaxID=1232801 RepID=UPI001C91BC37|nr:uncharacterized protein LOC122371860 [Amphibalanus amphitrite]